MQALPMVVRIRFGRGSRVPLESGKNARVARLSASFLTLVSICIAFMGFWRLFEDLDLAGEFIVSAGILSHWQVWLAAAAGTQYIAWRLNQQYGRAPEPDDEDIFEPAAEEVSSSNPAGLRP